MIADSSAARVLGLVVLIAAGGCGSESGQPSSSPPAASLDSVPSIIGQAPESRSQVMDAKQDLSHHVPGLRRDFDEPLRAPAAPTGDPELDPLIAYLKTSFALPIKDGRRLVITLSTGARLLEPKQTYQEFVDKLMNEASDQTPADMIRNFCEKNRESSAVWPELAQHLPVVLLTPEEEEAIFSGLPDEGWKRFYVKYPDAYGKITVSRVGLNRDNTLALFYLGVGQGMLLGHGQLHVLKKEGDTWVELPVKSFPAWTA
jgi:hypothetical protein